MIVVDTNVIAYLLLGGKRRREPDLFSNETQNGRRPYCGEANFEAYWRCLYGKGN